MPSAPMALGYLRTDGGSHPDHGLDDDQVRFRRQAIKARAAEDKLTLKGTYVEDIPGARIILSRLFSAAYFYIAHDEVLDAVIVFEDADLGLSELARARTRARLDDLGVRLVIISSTSGAHGLTD
jgi:hypothetical protein